MRKIAATYLFPCNQPPIKNGILICDDDGTILEIIDNRGELIEQENLEFYSGILIPGFVNAHCHLELSHLQGKIVEKTGIGGFIGSINQLRNEVNDDREVIMQKTDRRMWMAGIAAVGDISNSVLSIETKRKSKIHYHTFIESFGFHPTRAERAFDFAKMAQVDFHENGLKASITPHSPYSVSEPLFNLIKENGIAGKSILSIHNQESKAEAQFFIDGTGAIANHLQHNLGIDISNWKPTGKSSLLSILQFLPKENQLLLVHNTFTENADIEEIKKCRSLGNTFFVICPNSNLFIENQLPAISLFQKEKLNICIGTDSLASNHNLSVLAELITLQQNFPEITLDNLFKWACSNGARALKIETQFGTLETGKKPGINLVSGIDFRNMKLTGKSKVKRLI